MALLAAGGAANQGPDVLIATTFLTSLTYAAALERLDAYYDEQVGRTRSVAFPEIAPSRHFEVWHDLWAFFEPSGDRTQVTLKRPADADSARVVKSWMLDIAGRLNSAERQSWQFDVIEFSVIENPDQQLRWEAYWLDRYRDEHKGKLPIYNKVGGTRAGAANAIAA